MLCIIKTQPRICYTSERSPGFESLSSENYANHPRVIEKTFSFHCEMDKNCATWKSRRKIVLSEDDDVLQVLSRPSTDKKGR